MVEHVRERPGRAVDGADHFRVPDIKVRVQRVGDLFPQSTLGITEVRAWTFPKRVRYLDSNLIAASTH
jgi:hypothetical protein